MWDAATVYTIGHAARLTGVPSATLRAWERRYGLVTPVRTDGGYRLYDEAGLQLLRAMAALVAAGWSPREAAEHLRADNAATASQARQQPWDAYLSATTEALTDAGSAAAESSRVLGQGDPGGGGAPEDRPDPDAPVAAGAWDVTALARGAAEMDPAAVGEAVDRAFAAGSFEQVVDTWLMPALQMLGDQWKAGRVDVAGEHVVSATLHRRLGAAMEAVSTAPAGRRVTVGLARGSHHELGILAFSVVLRQAGVDVVYLGADLPAQHWVAVVEHHEPAVVVLGVPTAADVLAARETVAALRAARPGLTVHVGGGAQFEVGQGTVPLGHAVAAAAHRLAEGLRTAEAD